jgi:glycopeptide antibiotics resistance protein
MFALTVLPRFIFLYTPLRVADMFRQLLYLFLPYRSMFAPFLLASAVAVACWLIFRVYRHRARGRPVSLRRELLLLVFVVYLAGLASATLTPNRSSRVVAEGTGGVKLRPDLASLTCAPTLLPEGSSADRFCARNAAGNVALFLPLGILIPLVWRRLGFREALGTVVAISFGIEVVQYFSSAWGSYRAADVNDLILNSLGALIGLGFVWLLRWRPGSRPPPDG